MRLIVIEWCLSGADSDIIGLDAVGGVVGVDDLWDWTTLASLCFTIESWSDDGTVEVLAKLVISIDVSFACAELALSWGKVIEFRIGDKTWLADECLIDNLLVTQALLTFVSLNIVYLVYATYDTSLISQVIQTSIGAVKAGLFFIPDKGSIFWTAGEVVGGWSLEHFDLVVAFTDRTVVPVLYCQVILEITAIQIHQPSGLFVYRYIAVVAIDGLIDQFEVLLSKVEQLVDIWGNEGAIWTSRHVGFQQKLLFLGIGDVVVQFRPIEGGDSWTYFVLGAD